MKTLRYILITALAAVTLCAATGNTRAQTVEGLQIKPADSAEAERTRIWAAAEGAQACRMTITIVNDSNRVVRNFIEFLAPRGYYNFYWDKLDDSGARVPEGKYRAKVDYCKTIDYENLTVQYSPWEIQSTILPLDKTQPFTIELKLDSGACPVRAELLDLKGHAVDVMINDTTLGAGTHRFTGRPPVTHKPSNFVIRVFVGTAEYRREVSYLP